MYAVAWTIASSMLVFLISFSKMCCQFFLFPSWEATRKFMEDFFEVHNVFKHTCWAFTFTIICEQKVCKCRCFSNVQFMWKFWRKFSNTTICNIMKWRFQWKFNLKSFDLLLDFVSWPPFALIASERVRWTQMFSHKCDYQKTISQNQTWTYSIESLANYFSLK